jgi:hypothetical protein
MSPFELTRLTVLVSFVALAGSPAAAASRALARPGPGGIRVDVAPVLANYSGEPTAGWVAQTLPPQSHRLSPPSDAAGPASA